MSSVAFATGNQPYFFVADRPRLGLELFDALKEIFERLPLFPAAVIVDILRAEDCYVAQQRMFTDLPAPNKVAPLA